MIARSRSGASAADGGQPLGQEFAMAAVRSQYEVMRVQMQALPDGGRLLPDRQVRRAGMAVADAAIQAVLLEAVQRGLNSRMSRMSW